MQTKYKIGDKVIINQDLDTNEVYGDIGVDDDMLEYQGKTATIESINNNYDSDSGYIYQLDIDGGNFYWTDSMLNGEDKTAIKIKYFDDNMTEMVKTEKGDWIDLRCVGGIRIFTEGKISQSIEGFKLSRKSSKVNVSWEDGIFEEDGRTENVKFFRYNKGDFLLLDLGIGTKLPEGYEANIVPRSSTFKTFSFLQTNSFGVVDETYCGDNDKYFMPVLTMQDGFIMYDERLCQMRINKKMDNDIKLVKINRLGDTDRGGHGLSGTK